MSEGYGGVNWSRAFWVAVAVVVAGFVAATVVRMAMSLLVMM